MRRTAAAVKALWLEFRVAAQFRKDWDRVEDALVRDCVRRGQPLPPEYVQDSEEGRVAQWMQEVDPPRWFVAHELGCNDADHVWMTPAEIGADNHRRALEEIGRQRVLEQAARPTSHAGPPASSPA